MHTYSLLTFSQIPYINICFIHLKPSTTCICTATSQTSFISGHASSAATIMGFVVVLFVAGAQMTAWITFLCVSLCTTYNRSLIVDLVNYSHDSLADIQYFKDHQPGVTFGVIQLTFVPVTVSISGCGGNSGRRI